MDAFKNIPDTEVEEWHHALLELIETYVTKCTTEYQRRFPKLPTSPDMHQRERWAAWCIAAMSRAKQEKKEVQRLHEKKCLKHKAQRMQSGSLSNQKKSNKLILGKTGKQLLGAVKDPETNEIHTEPAQMREYSIQLSKASRPSQRQDRHIPARSSIKKLSLDVWAYPRTRHL